MKVGIDLVETARFKEMSENKKHLAKIFLPKELEYIETKRTKIEGAGGNSTLPVQNTIAGLYAAKEAVFKASNIGVNNGVSFLDILIDHNKEGAPIVKLFGKMQEWQKKSKITEIELSITHDGGFASAICIIK